ncbi:MAG: ArgR family transcriptional regulator [Chlamydiae bacterium]|nr:ArgR family transcriptional regulator [Chlamydiota bacterium]
MTKKEASLLDDVKKLLMGRKANSQETICLALEKLGYKINQTKVSRLLKRVGAIKIVNTQGQTVYSLPREPAPPSMNTKIRDLILDITMNEMLVVIFTSPGSASMVARVLDYQQISTEILGTIAGDDTIFVAPKSMKNTAKLAGEIRRLFQE